METGVLRSMQRYLTSDLHLGHANIIDHCDRPFTDVEEMNETLIQNWNQTVREQDIVFFLGDLGHFADEEQLREWLGQLHGRIVFIEGNHDNPSRYTSGLNTHQYYLLNHGDHEFCLTHAPENVPRFWSGWIVHGHHHNNDLEEHPLVDPDSKQINVSVELTGYKPVADSELVELTESTQTIQKKDSETVGSSS